VHTDKLCVGATCVTPEQFAEVFGGSQSAAAGAPSSGVAPEAPAASPATEGSDADAATTTATNVAELSIGVQSGPTRGMRQRHNLRGGQLFEADPGQWFAAV